MPADIHPAKSNTRRILLEIREANLNTKGRTTATARGSIAVWQVGDAGLLYFLQLLVHATFVGGLVHCDAEELSLYNYETCAFNSALTSAGSDMSGVYSLRKSW